MTEETTRAAVTDLYSAYAGGDGERMAALIADDVDFIIYGPVQVFPFAGHHQGSCTRSAGPHCRGLSAGKLPASGHRDRWRPGGSHVGRRVQAALERSHAALSHRRLPALPRWTARRIPRVHEYLRCGAAGTQSPAPDLSGIVATCRLSRRHVMDKFAAHHGYERPDILDLTVRDRE